MDQDSPRKTGMTEHAAARRCTVCLALCWSRRTHRIRLPAGEWLSLSEELPSKAPAGHLTHMIHCSLRRRVLSSPWYTKETKAQRSDLTGPEAQSYQ